MNISVALCTYNGAKFIEEQLDSILQQTVNISEIIICDDQSTDGTIEILYRYAEKHTPLFTIYRNETRLNSTKNFEKAISLCSGNIIFLADQDDYWFPNKVEKIINIFNKNPGLDVICTNGFVMDENSELLENHFVMWDVFGKYVNDNMHYYYFNFLTQKGNFATGATMAFTKAYKTKILPIPIIENFFHDEWIALIASSENKIRFLDEKLIKYRIHNAQQLGGIALQNNEETYTEVDSFFRPNYSTDFQALKHKIKDQVKWHNRLLNKIDKQTNGYKIISAVFTKEYNKNISKLNNYPLKKIVMSITDKILNKRKLEK